MDEIEIVARTLYAESGHQRSWEDAFQIDRDIELKAATRAIISLDSHRANNAGEVEDALRLHAHDDCDGKDVPTHICNMAANLISSLRAVIAEKDEALRPFVDYLNAIDPQDFASDQSEIGIEIIGPFRRAIKFRDLRRARSAISDSTPPTHNDGE